MAKPDRSFISTIVSFIFLSLPIYFVVVGPAQAVQLATTKDHITYVLIPHPDDEYEAWALIQNQPTQYPVFVLLTRGEGTDFCVPANYSHSWQPQLGELPAIPTPTNKYTASCT